MSHEKCNVVAIGLDFNLTFTSTSPHHPRTGIIKELQDTNKDLDFMIDMRLQEIEELERIKLKNIDVMESL